MSALLILATMHAAAYAAPPVLDIASEPLTAACRVAAPPASVGNLDGASLVLPRLSSPSSLSSSPSSSGGAELFQASMNMTDWGGHFTRYVFPPGGVGVVSAPVIAWDAGAILTGDTVRAPRPAPAERKIHTAIVQADGTLAMVPFEWNALSAGQRDLLSPGADGLSELRVAYLRGDRAQEGKLFRPRSSVLGNSVNSTPVYVGPPVGATSAVRPDVVYLGANDGMLHAFDAANGSELFAYIPAALVPTLSRLTDPAAVHRAYVDGPASAGEAQIAGNRRTVLVSGMGGGAQGVFALDVTDPARFADGGVLWEFTDRDDAMMGNVNTLPQIAKLRTRVSAGVAIHRHFAVVASGLNNYADDGYASVEGQGALFLLALDKPRGAPWRLNDNYYRLITPIADASLANALNAPVLVADRDGALTYAYAGDLQGNLWRFDFSGGAPWSGAVGPGAGKTPLFVARDAGGKRQAITQQPLLAYAGGGGYLVLFGTGKLIETADRAVASFAPQSYYAIRDSLRTPAEIVTNRRQLAQRVLGGDPASPLLIISGDEMSAYSMGWYLDLLQAASTGERSIDSGLLASGLLVFNTLLPSLDPCGRPRSRTYVLDVLTGLANDGSVTAKLPPAPSIEQPIVGDLSDGYVAAPALLPATPRSTARDSVGTVRVERDFALVDLTPDGARAIGKVKAKVRAGRLSWREVANWRQLHEASK